MAQKYHPRPTEEEFSLAMKGAMAVSTEYSKQNLVQRFKSFVVTNFQEAGEV